VTRLEFWILTGFSLLLASVIGFELFSSDKLDETESLARQAQVPVMQDEQMQSLGRRMVERTAQGAARDPALKDLLSKYGFKVTITPVAPAALIAPTSTPASANPVTSSNP
jgi:hypothetical protein